MNHKRRILNSTTGHPGRWNDKTLARFDPLLSQLQRGSFDDMMTFQCSTNQGKSIKIKGAYVIVDNGYLDWSTTVPPFKDSMNKSEVRFSQWLESLRKDVECTFGILKSRWRILKTGIRLHSTKAADVWLTCCALHNMLLEVDGLSKGWENGIPSFWTSDRNGDLDFEDLPHAIRRLNAGCPSDAAFIDRCRSVDLSRFGSELLNIHSPSNEHQHEHQEGSNRNTTSGDELPLRSSDVVSVNQLPLKQFRSMLVQHFNCQYMQSNIVWPKRLVKKPRHVPN